MSTAFTVKNINSGIKVHLYVMIAMTHMMLKDGTTLHHLCHGKTGLRPAANAIKALARSSWLQ
ncbi:MAG: hypothetical protein HZA07_07470 [Nitrospirae bacterium]|nr:hypothetical protein [Nitrospirota bacterium]